MVSADEALGHPWGDQGDELPEARVLAGELDLNHVPEPGCLQEIGTCRKCGLIIAQDKQGIWSHQPSVGELDAGEAWIDRNPSNGEEGQSPTDLGELGCKSLSEPRQPSVGIGKDRLDGGSI